MQKLLVITALLAVVFIHNANCGKINVSGTIQLFDLSCMLTPGKVSLDVKTKTICICASYSVVWMKDCVSFDYTSTPPIPSETSNSGVVSTAGTEDAPTNPPSTSGSSE